jgi:hypothetical protein
MVGTDRRTIYEVPRARGDRVLPLTFCFKRLFDFSQWQAIHHILFGEPAFARDPNAEPQILQTLSAMSVGVEYAFNTFLFGQRPPAPI